MANGIKGRLQALAAQRQPLPPTVGPGPATSSEEEQRIQALLRGQQFGQGQQQFGAPGGAIPGLVAEPGKPQPTIFDQAGQIGEQLLNPLGLDPLGGLVGSTIGGVGRALGFGKKKESSASKEFRARARESNRQTRAAFGFDQAKKRRQRLLSGRRQLRQGRRVGGLAPGGRFKQPSAALPVPTVGGRTFAGGRR